MTPFRLIALGALGLGAAGCVIPLAVPVPARTARAMLVDASGRTVGNAALSEVGGGLKVSVRAAGLPAGVHGIHFHQAGVCAGPDFASAGPHWNPTARQHGLNNPAGAHSGDLPNITIGADGRGTLDVTVPNASLRGGAGGPALLDADGAALVIHAAFDDLRTDPSGNSGARVACGVLG